MPSLLNPFDTLKPRFAHQDLVGWVVDNVDPDKRQRVRVRVPQLHRNVPDDKLPWAIMDSSQSRANAGAGAGSVNVPVKGSKIYVRFEENDPHNPRYSGSPATDDVNKDNELLKEDYPHSRGTIDDAGNRTNVNTEKETIDVTHKSGTTIHIDANGTVSITTAGDFQMGVNGKCTIVSTGAMTLQAPTIDLNPGGISATAATARARPEIADPAGKTTY